MRTLTWTVLFRAAVLAWLSTFQASMQAGELIEREPFESLEGITAMGGQRELSSEVVREGRTSLKFSATVNPQDALLVKQFPHPVDLSAFNALRFWIYPDVPEAPFSLEVRLVVWNDEKGQADWYTVGNIGTANAPNRKWSRLCFYLGKVPRKKVMRPFDLIAWHSGYRWNQPVTFYLDDLAFEHVPLEHTGLLINGGFEGELIPWQMGDLTREGEATLDEAICQEGQSSLRLSSPPGKASPTVAQTFEVQGGHWYRLSLWMRTQGVRGHVGAQVVLGGIMTDDRGIRLAGTHDFTFISRIFHTQTGARQCQLTLRLAEGGTAWFDGLRVERLAGEKEGFLSILGMPPRRTLLWRPEVSLPTVLRIGPPQTRLRVGLEPGRKEPFALDLVGEEGGEVPLLRSDGTACYARDGTKWKELADALLPFWEGASLSLVIYVDVRSGAFAVNTCGGLTTPWHGPFHLAGTLGEIKGVKLLGQGPLRRLLVEGPLWTPDEVEHHRQPCPEAASARELGNIWPLRRQLGPDRMPQPLRA